MMNNVLTIFLGGLQLPKPKVDGGPGKKKRTRDDDIPLRTPSNMVLQVDHLRDLQDRLLCTTHSKPGMRTYCWIELAEQGVKGGHREFSHSKLTLWAKYIVSSTNELDCNENTYLRAQARGLATMTCPPNIKKLDHPPIKKLKVARALEFHIAVNLATPAGGPALQGTCVVSDAPIPQASLASTPGPSAPGPTGLEEPTSLEGSSSAADPPPLGHATYIPRAYEMLLEMLAQQASMGRVPSTHNVLTWMDAVNPDVNGDYIESHSELLEFGIYDMFDIMETEVCFLATIGDLGRGGTIRLHHFTQDHILLPLGLWATAASSIDTFEVQTDM
jgi:hypothetical protein